MLYPSVMMLLVPVLPMLLTPIMTMLDQAITAITMSVAEITAIMQVPVTVPKLVSLLVLTPAMLIITTTMLMDLIHLLNTVKHFLP